MSTEQSSVDPELVEQTKQQIRNLVREIAQIAKSDIAPLEFYDAVLNRIVTALAAVGGAVWTVTETGQLSLEYQINLRQTRLAAPQAVMMEGSASPDADSCGLLAMSCDYNPAGDQL